MNAPRRWRPWVASALLAPVLLAALLSALFIAVFGWNWLRGPIESLALERTGRILRIGGDIRLGFNWPWLHLQAGAVSFANPPWALEKQMISAQAVQLSIDPAQLLLGRLHLPEVRLQRPVVFLEQGSAGRRNWLLDLNQRDEEARIHVDRIEFDEGRLGYDDVAQKTSIRTVLSTGGQPEGAAGLRFTAQGRLRGLPLEARGMGGPVLGLRDENQPYPLQAELAVGGTHVTASGSISGLLGLSAVDLRLALRGDSLAQLFGLLGMPLPATPGYAIDGQLVRSAQSWRYEKFTGRIGQSDIAGRFEIDTGGRRPAIAADLVSESLAIGDLGHLIGAGPTGLGQSGPTALLSAGAASAPLGSGRLLPNLRLNADRWGNVDALVTLQARTLHGANKLALEDLKAHLVLRNAVMTLDPLDFKVAGGQLKAALTLDGRSNPIQARIELQARRILLAELLPAAVLADDGEAQFNGDLALAGPGNTVRRMLGGASGKLRLVVEGGEFSPLMMERAGPRLWPMLQLRLSGDKRVRLRCGMADFNVRNGVMSATTLMLDNDVGTMVGRGRVDLRQETLNLTLTTRRKNAGLSSLRSPILIGGSFAQPAVEVDTDPLALRANATPLLRLSNPLLALAPLIEAGPGSESDCANLMRTPATVAQAPVKAKTKLRK